MSDRIPLTIVTGFLGSGKTTLVNRLLAGPDAGDVGVVVNEFGDVGIDHRLFVHAADRIELIARGRARRADLSRAFHDLIRLSKTGESRIRRIVLETSGLADPSPAIAVLAEDPWLRAHVVLVSVVVVVDAVAGLANLQRFDEARRQVVAADTAVISKTDMRKAVEMHEVAAQVRAIAADLRVLDAQDPQFDPATAFIGGHVPDLPASKDLPPAPDGDFQSFVLRPEEPVDWPAFTVWLSSLLHAHGDRIMRVKGMLRTTSSQTPVAIHGVQNVMHPPTHLTSRQAGEARSHIVFILRDIEAAEIERSFRDFMRRFARAAA